MTKLIYNKFYRLQKRESLLLPPLTFTLCFIICLISCHTTAALIEYRPESISTNAYKMNVTHHLTPKIDLNNGIKLYQVIVQRNKSDVLRYLKNIHYNDKNNVQNHSKTEFWYWHERAARQGDAESQLNLGYMYLQGKGVSHDYIKARYWFELSSNQSDPVAKYFLGLLYYDGKGVNKNPKKAQILFKESCSDGLSQACLCLTPSIE